MDEVTAWGESHWHEVTQDSATGDFFQEIELKEDTLNGVPVLVRSYSLGENSISKDVYIARKNDMIILTLYT